MIVYCRIHCLLVITIMYVHSNLLTSVCTQLKFVLRSIVFQRLSFGSSSTKMSRKLCVSQLRDRKLWSTYMLKQIYNLLRMPIEKNIVVQTKCLLIYYTNVLKLF